MKTFRVWVRGNDLMVKVMKKMGLPWWLSSKEFTANAGDTGSVPGSGRFPGEENGNLSSILAWEILWTEEPGKLQSMGSQRVEHSLATK